MTLLIQNVAYLVQSADRVERDCDVLIEGNRIAAVGKFAPAADWERIDASGRAVIPGLVNAHTHLYQNFLKGLNDGVPLVEWCAEELYSAADVIHAYHWILEDERLGYTWSLLAALEMIEAGTTACINMDMSMDSIYQAWLDIGFRGVAAITKVFFSIRRVPAAETYAFYSFDHFEQAVDAAQAVQRQESATHMVSLSGGPKPTDYEAHDAFLHIVVRDSRVAAQERLRVTEAICESFGGYPLESNATRLYWEGHMYSWLRNTAPSHYYGNRPFMCPEVAGFLPTEKVKDAVAYLRNDAIEHAAEFAQHDIRIKCNDVCFSNNAAFIWIDTLYPELDDEVWKYGLALRSRNTDELCRRYLPPESILQAIAPEVMTKLGAGFDFMKHLKCSLDPNFILNPGVMYFEPEVSHD